MRFFLFSCPSSSSSYAFRSVFCNLHTKEIKEERTKYHGEETITEPERTSSVEPSLPSTSLSAGSLCTPGCKARSVTEIETLERGGKGLEETSLVGGPRRTTEEVEGAAAAEAAAAAGGAASEDELAAAASSLKGPTAASTLDVTLKTTSNGLSSGAEADSTDSSPRETRLEAEGGGAIPWVCSRPAPPNGVRHRRSSLPSPAGDAAAAAREAASPPPSATGCTSQTNDAAPLGGIGGGSGGAGGEEEEPFSLLLLLSAKLTSAASSPGEASNLGGSRERHCPRLALSIVASTSTAGLGGGGGSDPPLAAAAAAAAAVVAACASAGLTFVLTPSGAAAEKLKYCDRCRLSPVAGTV